MANTKHDVSKPISEDNPITTEFEFMLRVAQQHHTEMSGGKVWTEEEDEQERKYIKEANAGYKK